MKGLAQILLTWLILAAGFAFLWGRMWVVGKGAEIEAKAIEAHLIDAERRAYLERERALDVSCPLCHARPRHLCKPNGGGFDQMRPHAARIMAGRAEAS